MNDKKPLKDKRKLYGKAKKVVSESSDTKQLTRSSDQSEKQEMASTAVMSEINAAAVVDAFNIINADNVELPDVVNAIVASAEKVKTGDMSDMEAMLVSQSIALQSIFVHLAKKAAKQPKLTHYQTFLTLALKAQSQSRATIATLTELKFPRQVTFMRQSNIANGPQQVCNNSDIPNKQWRAREKIKP